MTGGLQRRPRESEPGRGLTLALLTTLLVITIGVWLYLVVNLWQLDPNQCLKLPSDVPGFRFVAAGIAGLLLGRYSGVLRYINTWDVEDKEEGGARSNTVGGIAVAIVLLALVPIFIYEAIGVYEPPNGLEPITYYVRCSIRIDDAYGNGYKTMGIIFLIAFLFGQWLWSWHPSRNQFRGRLGSSLGSALNQLANKRLWDMPQRRGDRIVRKNGNASGPRA